MTLAAAPVEERLPGDGVVRLAFFHPDDAAVLCVGDRDPELRRRFDFPDDFVPSLRHAREVIARWERERRARDRFTFAVRDAGSGELLGGCELLPLGGRTANVSYWTYPVHRRRGVATRAVALASDLAFTRLELERLELATDPDNVASRRVAIRTGFVEVGMREHRILHVKTAYPLAALTPDPPR